MINSTSRLINHLVIFIILILGIFTGVKLLQQPQTSIIHAIETPRPKLQVENPAGSAEFSARNVTVKITYAGGEVIPTSFRIANSEDDFSYALEHPFNQNPLQFPWRLSAGNGQKTVYVQFKVSGYWTLPISTSVSLDNVSNNKFLIGANIPNIIDYPYNDILPFSHGRDIDLDLKAVNSIGGSIVRVYVPYDKISSAASSQRLGDFLTQAAQNNIKVIPVLIDDYATSHNPQGTEQYYISSSSTILSLNHEFFYSGYKNEYLNFVKQVVSDNKDSSNIFAWEIGNELHDPSSTQTLLDFMADVSSTIKGLDPMHDIIAGIGSTEQVGLTPLQFYTTLPDIDIVSIHSYRGDHLGAPDVVWAHQNFRQSILEVESISGTRTDDRSAALQAELSYWRSLGLSGLLVPNFMASGIVNNGDGDKISGVDNIFHGDYNQLTQILQSAQR